MIFPVKVMSKKDILKKYSLRKEEIRLLCNYIKNKNFLNKL